MRICSVEGCQNNSNSENVSFFSFPNTEEDHAKWIKFTKKAAWLPTKNSTVCLDYFSPEVITEKRHHLQSGAIPTLKGGDQLSQCVKQGNFDELRVHYNKGCTLVRQLQNSFLNFANCFPTRHLCSFTKNFFTFVTTLAYTYPDQ
jgi:hypothetical protein